MPALEFEQNSRDVERRVQCFIAALLHHLPYQTVKDAAVDAVTKDRCLAPHELGPAVAEVAHWLLHHQIGDWLPAGWEPCRRLPEPQPPRSGP